MRAAELRAPGVAGALARYRLAAWVVGAWLIALVFVAIPLQLAGDDILVRIIGTSHGYLYIVYLVLALDLARRARFTALQMLAMVGAGLLPGLAFVIERRVTARVAAGLAAPWRRPGPAAAAPGEPGA